MVKQTLLLFYFIIFACNSITPNTWQQCTDELSNFECKEYLVPRVYDQSIEPKTEGTLKTMHRRLKVGTPDKYIFLISGGPGGNADVVTYAVVPQLQEAFPEGNFIVHIPSLRGTVNTDRIPVYDGFPSNLQGKIDESDYSADCFNPTNSAKDIIAAVQEAQQDWPTLTFHAMGFSFGTFQLQRVLEIEPNLFSTVILDGTMDSINSNNLFEFQQAGLGSLTERLEENCNRSDYCHVRSLSRERLANFIDQISQGETNDCLNWFVEQIYPGAPAFEVLSSAINSLAMASNIDIPPEFVSADPTTLENQKKFVDYALNTFNGNFSKQGYIYMDMRVYYWVLLNQIAQCQNLENFKQGAGYIIQIIKLAGSLIPYMLSSASPLGNAYVTQILNLAAENITNLAVNQEYIEEQQAQGPIRTPSSMYTSQIELVKQVTPVAPPMSKYVGTSPVNVTAHVVFLIGLLDPNVPLTQTQGAISHLNVKENVGIKESFIHNNAGHTVIGLGYSKCSPKLMRGIVASDNNAMNQYKDCLNEENSNALKWEASDVKSLLNKDIWLGITVRKAANILSIFQLFFLAIVIIN